MLFELTNILISFQEDINKIFIKKLDIFVIMYLDNIFSFTLIIKKIVTLQLYNRF